MHTTSSVASLLEGPSWHLPRFLKPLPCTKLCTTAYGCHADPLICVVCRPMISAATASSGGLTRLTTWHPCCRPAGKGLRSNTPHTRWRVRIRRQQCTVSAGVNGHEQRNRLPKTLTATGKAALFTGAYISVAGIAVILAPKTCFGLLFNSLCANPNLLKKLVSCLLPSKSQKCCGQ